MAAHSTRGDPHRVSFGLSTLDTRLFGLLGTVVIPNEAFLHYLRQDYVFLIHFSRAWALAVTKAESVDEMRHAAATVNALVNEEIALHIDVCAKAGIDEAALFATEERAENLAYTRYVLDAGHSGDILDLLAALAPCVMGYGEIGRYLSTNASSDTYKQWIDTYAGDEYQQVCVSVGGLIDVAVKQRIGVEVEASPRWSALCRRFDLATRLEVGFWDMGLRP